MPDPPEPDARLVVHRTSPADVRQRQVNIDVDGARAATVYYGDAVSIPLTAGPHTLRAHNTLVWKTIAFEARAGEDVHVAIVNRAARGFTWLMTILGVGPIMVDLELGVRSAAAPVDARAHAAARRTR